MTEPSTELSADIADRLVRELLPEANQRLVRTVDGLADDEYAAPTDLTAWTRAHVVAHLVLNGEGLAAALRGVIEAKRIPMYASQEARDGDIDELSGAEPAELRERLLASCTDLEAAIAGVPDTSGEVTIERVPGGPVFTVADVPWMRYREVEIHHADLAAGYDRSAWAPEFCAHVLDTMRTRGIADATFTVDPTDLDGTWQYGEGGPTLTGRAADLAWWLTGRGSGEGVSSPEGELPRVGAW